MKLFSRKVITRSTSQPDPAQSLVNFNQVKALLKALSPQELIKALKAAEARATPDRVPLTIRALPKTPKT